MKAKFRFIPCLLALALVCLPIGRMGLLAQSLPKLPHLENCDPQGYFYFKEGKLPSGSCFGALRDSFLFDPLETVQITRTWTDPILGLDHVRYQQYYDGKMVEGAEFIEHSKAGHVLLANGKLAHGFPALTVAPIPESEALNKLLIYLGSMDYAWLHLDWETEIKLDTGDSAASYYPKGTLMWSLDHFTDLAFLIDGGRYRLGWRFEVLAFGPEYIHKNYFVDAQTGEIYREDEIGCSNGPADILTQGSRIIDTQPDLGKFQLHATELGRDIRTKYFDGDAWTAIPNIKDDDDNWGSSEQLGTTAHWMVTLAWIYFNYHLGWEGMDDKGKQVRVYADWDGEDAQYDPNGSKDYLKFGTFGGYMAVLDVGGHEFTHGIIHYSCDLNGSNEPGALAESFGDIFGVMVERYAQGGTYNWVHGDAFISDPYFVRSLSDPFNFGYNFPIWYDCGIIDLGQPDTYMGPLWYVGPCDDGGEHVNDGVQNKWFYLLAAGGTHNGQPVTGIGIESAAQITFYSMTNILTSSSQYVDARLSAIIAANILFGNCSPEAIQTTNAWAAVGVGLPSGCPTIGVDPSTASLGQIEVFPNPTSGVVRVRCFGSLPEAIHVTDLAGRKVMAQHENLSATTEMDLSGMPAGIYIFTVLRQGMSQHLKVVLQ